MKDVIHLLPDQEVVDFYWHYTNAKTVEEWGNDFAVSTGRLKHIDSCLSLINDELSRRGINPNEYSNKN